jgi:DNA modification methylase
MNIRTINVAAINPAPYNPRKDLAIDDSAYKQIKASLDMFGCVEPLVWNESTGNLVSGHQRFKIHLAQGCTTLDVSVVSLSLEQEKALNLAMNKISGHWDEDRLAEIINELTQIPDINIQLTGFSLPEVSEILDNFTPIKSDVYDIQADIDIKNNAITQPGDIICLGRHKVMCGDSADPESYKKLLGDTRINLIHTDPPYNVAYNAGERPAKGRKGKWKQIEHDNLVQSDYENWLKCVFEAATPYMEKGAPFYIWNGFRQFAPMQRILAELGLNCVNIITWAKPTFGLSYADYNPQTEFCLYGWKNKNGAHKWYGPTNESSLWEVGRDSIDNYIHPTQKPAGLALRALRNSSIRADTVMDMFLGSGSTLIAAEMLGRSCYGIELDPRYCDAIVRRYIAFTGDTDESLDIYRKEASDARRK